jgi:hypothetical protein
MAAYGIPQTDIGLVIGCDPKTLRLHFQTELETGLAEANAKVAQSLFQRATGGVGKEAVTACIFWLKCRAGWRDQPVDLSVGKKEQAQAAADTAGVGTDWGDDLDSGDARLN